MNSNQEVLDSDIDEFDSLWSESIFTDSYSTQKNKLVSYFSTVYLTRNDSLIYKSSGGYKDEIEKYTKIYTKTNPYDKKTIMHDICVYLAVKIIIEKSGIVWKKRHQASFDAEQSKKSITYKTLHLLNAYQYYGVMPPIINAIIDYYCSIGKLDDIEFEEKFGDFLDELFDDALYNKNKYLKIHNCSQILWSSALKAKDSTLPRRIASRLLKLNVTSDDFSLSHSEIVDLDSSFNEWTKNWNFTNDGDEFTVKILLINLLLSKRKRSKKAYKSKTVKIEKSYFTSKFNAKDLHLDHLESKEIGRYPEKHFMGDNPDERLTFLNSHIGNFMLLDSNDNIDKGNISFIKGLEYYKKFDDTWLLQDIYKMTEDEQYFDKKTEIPKQEFFTFRTARLIKYFEYLLNSKIEDDEYEVKFK